MNDGLTAKEFIDWLFQKGAGNDNIAGAAPVIDRDLHALFNLWSFNANRHDAWRAGVHKSRSAVMKRLVDEAHLMYREIGNVDAVWTACCLGIVKTLFDWMAQLGNEEKIYILEEIAKATDRFVDTEKNKKSGAA